MTFLLTQARAAMLESAHTQIKALIMAIKITIVITTTATTIRIEVTVTVAVTVTVIPTTITATTTIITITITITIRAAAVAAPKAMKHRETREAMMITISIKAEMFLKQTKNGNYQIVMCVVLTVSGGTVLYRATKATLALLLGTVKRNHTDIESLFELFLSLLSHVKRRTRNISDLKIVPGNVPENILEVRRMV